MKYAPLRWELKQKYPGYEISQYNIIVHVLGDWSTDLEIAVKELVGRRHRDAEDAEGMPIHHTEHCTYF